MNKEDLTKIFGELITVNELNGVYIINSKFFSPVDDKDYVIGIKEKNGEYILSDMGMTFKRLDSIGFDLESDIEEYAEQVRSYFFVSYNDETHEFLIHARKENLVLAYTNLLQCLIFMVNLELQVEEKIEE